MSEITRGRKPLTKKQKQESAEWQKIRVKVANMVARKSEINKKCCICGKEGKILHNKQDPYYIAFICDECKKDANNLLYLSISLLN